MAKFNPLMNDIDEAISIKYNNIVYEKKARGEDVIVLSLGEAFFDLPLFPFDDLPFPALYHYSHSRGLLSLREKLSKYFSSEYDFSFNPDTEIIITAGSKIAIHMSFMALLEPGDEVIILEPYWVSYTEQVKLCNAKPVTVPLNAPLSEIQSYITTKTKCIVINTPNNPAGKIYSKEELTTLLKIAQANDIYLMSDEAYSDFIPQNKKFVSLGSIDRELKNSIVCNSISKNYGISGWRLGYVISNKDIIYQILKINQHLITCPATILEYYIEKHFEEIISITKPQIMKTVNFRAKVKTYLIENKYLFAEGDAAWYFLLSISPTNLSSDEFCIRLLNEYNVAVVPGIGYGETCDSYVRLAVGSEPWERVKLGIDRISELISKTS
jgi:aminotransferase